MATLKTPLEFFGKNPGDDYVMIRWDALCDYYREAAKISDRLILQEKGKTSEGNDFLFLYVSSPENLKNLEEYRKISMALSDSRNLSESEINDLVKKGKVIVFQSYGLHSNEVGGPQMVPHMLYELLTSNEERILKILDEVIFIISPCSEPDGEIVFTDWYHKYLGTPHEGCVSPYLRHLWAGHSNNRDSLRECVIESRHLNDIIVRGYMPQIVQDHHHQCPDENRMSIAPVCDPIFEHICPLVHRETALYGSHKALALSAAGRKGIVSGDPFFSNFPLTSFYGNALLHNSAGMLTENADVRIATPDYIDPETLKLATIRNHVLTPCAACPDPWEGGWWHLRDIVDQMYIASVSLLEYASVNREAILKSTAQKALYQTKRGHQGDIKGYVITKEQNDLSAAQHLITLMHNQRVEMFKLTKDINDGDTVLKKGSVFIPLYQPFYAVVQAMLEEAPFNKEEVKKMGIEGSKDKLCDVTSICMSLSMGVKTHKLGFEIPQDSLTLYTENEPQWFIPESAKENLSYYTANVDLENGKKIGRDEFGNFKEITNENTNTLTPVRRARVGLLKLGLSRNEEEGFTRSFLRMYNCDYRIIMDSEIRENGVPEDMDVVILPGDRSSELSSGENEVVGAPKEYRSGLGTTGQRKLKEFVLRGGRVVTWEKSCDFVNATLGLHLVDRSVGLKCHEYLTSGTQLNATIEKENHFLTYGMPKKFTLAHTNGPILVPQCFDGKVEILAKFADHNVLKNGLLRGEDKIASTPCMLYAKCEKGDVVLFTFNPEFRTQQDGTFKLLLNTLYKEI